MSKRFVEPEWEKIEQSSHRTGLSISEVFRRCMTEEVLSVHLIKPGKRKGTRLVNRKSLDEYIRSFLPGGSRFRKSQRRDLAPSDAPNARKEVVA